jgi:hypothetical protein
MESFQFCLSGLFLQAYDGPSRKENEDMMKLEFTLNALQQEAPFQDSVELEDVLSEAVDWPCTHEDYEARQHLWLAGARLVHLFAGHGIQG